MSRRIEQHTNAYTEEYRAFQDTAAGKLLFTRCKGADCALLMQENRLTVAHVLQEQSSVGSVYLGIVRNVVPNINACFVEFQEGKLGFLPLKEATAPFLCNRKYDGRLIQGDILPVQVTREAQKNKQASLTADVSLSNDYFALAFGSPHTGFSTKLQKEQKQALSDALTESRIIVDGNLNQELVTVQTAFTLPTVGMIVRTRAAELSPSLLIQQFQKLLEEWNLFLRDAASRVRFSCLKAADDILSGVLDNMIATTEYEELITDDEALYTKLQEYAKVHFPEKNVRLYQDEMLSLNKLYNLDSRLDIALRERVWLKSGGYLIIQPTEALTVIDVNSGKFEAKNKAGEESALKINREAAEEIAIQMRLRNLSGIIIVDFINLRTEENRQKLMCHMRNLIKRDKIKTTVVDMTPLGLVEITRQKITKPLWEQFRAIEE